MFKIFFISYIIMESVNNMLDFVNNNKILSSVLGLFLVLYAAMAAPKLPKSVAKIFDNTYFKLGFMFMIGYLATKDPSTAIISAVGLLLTLQTLSSYEAAEKFSSNSQSVSPKSVSPRSRSPRSRSPRSRSPRSRSPRSRSPGSRSPRSVTPRLKLKLKVMKSPRSVTISLSPTRADFINECMKKAEVHYGKAQDAMVKGNATLAEVHKQEAVKQEIKADSAVKVKQHSVLAEKAASEGKVSVAQEHQKEAVKQEVKVESLVKAEAHKKAALVAKQNGDVRSVEKHMKQANKQEAKANALIKADENKEKAVRALQEGKPEEARKLVVTAEKIENKVLSSLGAASPSSVPMPVSPGMHAKVRSRSSSPRSRSPRSRSPRSRSPRSASPRSASPKSRSPTPRCPNNNTSVDGYSGGNYAPF
jgi:hypothetical protein